MTFLGLAEHRAGAAGDAEILRTAGRPHSEAEIAIIVERGNPVTPGEAGEVVVRGAQVMSGYWRADPATADAMTDGWLRTGVAYDSVRRATALLRERGLIVTVHGKGTFVAQGSPTE